MTKSRTSGSPSCSIRRRSAFWLDVVRVKSDIVAALTVAAAGTYTLTPSLAGYAFNPPSMVFTNVAANLLPLAFQAQAAAGGAPVITGPLSLPSGPVGMGFMITGSNFVNPPAATSVTLGGLPMNIVLLGQNSITVQVPAGAMTGNVVVTVGGVASNASP